MTVLSFLVFFSIVFLSIQYPIELSDKFSIVNTNSANLSDYDSFLIYSDTVDRMRCLTICQLAPLCRTVLFFLHSSLCRVYSMTEYFSNDGQEANIIVFNRFSQGILINTYSFHANTVMSIVKLNDGLLASGSMDNSIKIFDPYKNKVIPGSILPDPSCNGIQSLAVVNNDTLAIGCTSSIIHIWNMKNLTLLKTLTGHSGAVKYILKINDQLFASVSGELFVRIWNTTDGTCIKTPQNHTNRVFSLALLEDGNLASGSNDKSIVIWNLKTFSAKKRLIGHTSGVTFLTTLRNGNLASGSADSTIRIWNVSLGQTIMILEGHSDNIRCLLSYGENVLISGSYDRSIKVWDLMTGQARMTILGHKGNVMSIQKLENGSLASGSTDMTIKIWNI